MSRAGQRRATALTVPSPPPATITRRPPRDGVPHGGGDLVAAVRELDLGVQAGGLEVAGEPVDERLVVAAARAGVDDDDDRGGGHGVGERSSALATGAAVARSSGARPQNAVSALRQSASQATPSANAAATSLR